MGAPGPARSRDNVHMDDVRMARPRRHHVESEPLFKAIRQDDYDRCRSLLSVGGASASAMMSGITNYGNG